MQKLCILFVFGLICNEGLSLNLRPKRQTTDNNNSSSTTSTALRDCMRNCPVTAEYNPVCGSDNVTYNNPGSLACAQACGASITLLRSSRCPPQAAK